MKEKVTEDQIRSLVGRNLRRLRTLQNISQLNLALDAGLTHNFVNDIESGRRGISVRSLAKLSAALGVEPHQFFLPNDMDNIRLYVNDFNDSLQKLVQDLTDQYLLPPSKP